MRGLFHSKTRRTAGMLMAAVSSLLITACATQRASVPPLAKPPVLKRVLAARTLKEAMPVLSSVWEGGDCRYKDNSVSYHSFASGQTKTLKLDVKVKGTHQMLCSDSFTVLLGDGAAYVAIGAAPIMDGKEWFGRLGKRFTWANSYEIDYPEGVSGRVASISGNRLRVMGGSKNWSIDLSDPFRGWETY
ncbi:MAG: hypothetical protein AB1295_02610 [Candidatus Micrarchaeota archaeon]